MDSTPHRIVSLQPSVTDILVRLGLRDRIVACTRHCRLIHEELAGLPSVEDSWTARCTQIAAAHPDMVIAAVPFQPEAIAEILKSGARFLALAPRTLSDIYGDIAVIAQLFERAALGRQLIAGMQQDIGEVRERAVRANRSRVYCEEWGKPMLRSQPWVAELVAAAGGQFLGEPASPSSAEEIAVANPEVIIFAWCGAGSRVPLEKIVSERQWARLQAVRNNRFFCVRDDLLTTPSPILMEGLKALAATIHPELFPSCRGVRTIEHQDQSLA